MRVALQTISYVLAVSAVTAAALYPHGTARFVRRHAARLSETVRTVSESTTGAPVVAASGITRTTSPRQTRSRDLRPGEYRVPIGSVLRARLKHAIDSATAQANDQIDAVLSEPVMQGEVELIPSGSLVLGTIRQAVPATRDTPLGRVEIVFTTVRHAQTRSLAAIRTLPLVFEAEARPDSGRGKRAAKKQPIDLVLSPGHPVLLTLADPLVVYIPNTR